MCLRYFFFSLLVFVLLFSLSFSMFSYALPQETPSESSEASLPSSEIVSSAETPATDGYLSPDEFFAVNGEDYSVSVMSVQSSPNTPVTSASGLKGIMINLLGSYDPPVTQLRYQANSNSTYTYVNDIQPDFPWICSCAVFAIVLFCLFKMGGAILCKQ